MRQQLTSRGTPFKLARRRSSVQVLTKCLPLFSAALCRRRCLLTRGVAVIFFVTAPALANDSTAELKTGGLVLLKSSDIEMQSEYLFISTQEVKIHYVFRNNSPNDISTVIAFPMPRISTTNPGETEEIPNENADNFLDFSTSVNGRPTPVRAELRAYEGDQEITGILKAAGIPLAPHQRKTEDALDRLNATTEREFIKNKLVERQAFDRGHGISRHLLPRWSLATTYYFDQVFPAGKETTIDHQYRPSVGTRNVTSIGDPKESSRAWVKDEQEKYCIDVPFLNAVKAAPRPSYMEYGSPFQEQRISYILHTGANWAGPISDFHLVIDKGSPDNLMSFCGDGVTKTTPTRVEIRKSNFTPKNDINILILKPFPKTP